MGNAFLRGAALAAAALLLPCCRDQVGEGDALHLVTVRASLTTQGVEPNGDCIEPSISATGRFIVFASKSNTLTTNDDNGLQDIFLKDRFDGSIVNITKVDLFGEFPPYAPADCGSPSVSADGRYVLFRSKGGWVPYTAPASQNAHFLLFRYDRVAKIFERAFNDGGGFNPPNADLDSPTMSTDGRFVAFQTGASNLVPPNGSAKTQIYVHDMQAGTSVIASRARTPAALNVPCDDNCRNPRISSDGAFVAFESDSLTIDTTYAAGPTPQIYRGTSAGAHPVMVARNSAGVAATAGSYYPCCSEGGRYVVFLSSDTTLAPGAAPNPGQPILVRRDVVAGVTELVESKTAQFPFITPYPGYPSSVSGDGRFVAFLSREYATFRAQVHVRDMADGTRLASQHQDGTLCNLDCDPPLIAADGSWVVWSTKGSTLVDGDTNGVSDVFLRGPLR
jgi:Tol biopolymer transport system component